MKEDKNNSNVFCFVLLSVSLGILGQLILSLIFYYLYKFFNFLYTKKFDPNLEFKPIAFIFVFLSVLFMIGYLCKLVFFSKTEHIKKNISIQIWKTKDHLLGIFKNLNIIF